MEYILHLVILTAIYTMVAQGLNLSVSYAGLVSLAQAGFYGIGAYTAAILSTQYGCPFGASLAAAMIINGLAAILISLVVLRTAEDYFSICTLGVQIIIYALMNNLTQVTRGPMGIPDIPPIGLLDGSSKLYLTGVTFFCLGVTWWILYNLTHSGFGRLLKAVREDMVYTSSIGRDGYRTRVTAFTISAVLAAIPGVLYAHYITYVDPTAFTTAESIFILSIVIIGGTGSLTGCLLASAVVVFLPEALRFIGMPGTLAANLRQILYGTALMIMGLAKYKDLARKFI